jgi:hypothetical protein
MEGEEKRYQNESHDYGLCDWQLEVSVMEVVSLDQDVGRLSIGGC